MAGTSANTAVALAKLGASGSAFLGTIGDDQYGKYIQKDFKEQGVNTADLIVDPKLNTVESLPLLMRTERDICGAGPE